ncbi:MAG: aminopeptidase P family protein [bacterium]
MYSFPLQRKRREKLMNVMKDGLIYIKAKDEIIRNGDVPVKYRQSSNFLYLTAIEEINYHLVLDPKSNQGHLFIPNIDPMYLVWVGRMFNTQEAKKKFGAKQVHYYSDFEKVVSKLKKRYNRIYTMPEDKAFIKRHVGKSKVDTITLKKTLDFMRAFKDAEGIRLMKQASHINVKAFTEAMSTIKPGIYEYQVQALMEKVYRDNGAIHNSFQTIAAVGRNPAVLHYTTCYDKGKNGDLILLDAGCECHGYASDITRTFPVGKTFSKTQQAIYEATLDVNKKCIKASVPGVAFQHIHEQACRLIIEHLKDLRILKNIDTQELYQKDIHRLFFPHGLGHLLGLDVHDVGAGVIPCSTKPHKHMRSSVDLLPNMVVTIEPGIYFLEVYFKSQKERNKYKQYINWSVADKYYTVGGVRIEDDLLITKKGNINMTQKLVKDVKDIELLRKKAF